jgi:hypothetical protein
VTDQAQSLMDAELAPRVCAAHDSGIPKKALAGRFGITGSTVERYLAERDGNR